LSLILQNARDALHQRRQVAEPRQSAIQRRLDALIVYLNPVVHQAPLQMSFKPLLNSIDFD